MKKDISKLFLSKTSTIKDALEVIGKHDSRIALLCEKGRFLGIITDADIRHALVAKATLDTPVSKIYNKNPICLKPSFCLDEALAYSAKYGVYDFPILDDFGKVIGVKSLSSMLVLNKKKEKVLIMAGGLGSRLYPLTKNTPKPMLKIGQKPILQIIIERLIKQGFCDFYLCVNYKKEIIKDYFKANFAGAKITYLEEDAALGTAGGLFLYKKHLQKIGQKLENNFILMNADLLTKLDFTKLLSRLHEGEKKGIKLIMATRKLSYEFPFGVIKQDKEEVLQIKEKPKLDFVINAGIYALNESLLDGLKAQSFLDMPDFINSLLATGVKVGSFLCDEGWIDIGNMQDYERAKQA